MGLTLKEVERETQNSEKLLQSSRTDTQVLDGGKGRSVEEASWRGGKREAAYADKEALARQKKGLEKEERRAWQRWVKHGRSVPTKRKGWKKSEKVPEGQAESALAVRSRSRHQGGKETRTGEVSFDRH